MLHHHWATATLPPIFLNGDWRLWSCLVAMAASAFTFSPHSVQSACCLSPPPPTFPTNWSAATAELVCPQTGQSQCYLPPTLIPDALLIQPPTLHLSLSLLLMHSIYQWLLSQPELCSNIIFLKNISSQGLSSDSTGIVLEKYFVVSERLLVGRRKFEG